MWFEFDSMAKETRVSKNTGNPYECYVLRGTKLGNKDMPSAPWEKILFDNTAITVIEDDGTERPNMSAVQFFQYVKPGDVVTLMFTSTLPKSLYAVRRGKIYKDGTTGPRTMPTAYIPPSSSASVPSHVPTPITQVDLLPWEMEGSE